MASIDTHLQYLNQATRAIFKETPDNVTVNSIRKRAEQQNGLEKGFFVTPEWKQRSKAFITELVNELMDNEPPSSIPEPKLEPNGKNGVKRSSSDEPSPVAKRQKKSTNATTSKKPTTKRESLSDLDDLEDLDTKPKRSKETVAKKFKKATAAKPQSESELSDLSSSEVDQKTKKKGGRASKRALDSGDSDEASDFGNSPPKPKPKLKRKRVAPAKKQIVQRAKVESESESETARTKKPVDSDDDDDEAETKANTKDDGSPDTKTKTVTKSEESEEDTKVKKSPHVADDSDSSLSSVIDDPPPKRGKAKGTKVAPKSKVTAPKAAPKELTGDEAEIKKLQAQLVKCGVRKIWGIELKKFGDDSKAKVRHLKKMLSDVGMDSRFSEAKAKEIKERRELLGELEAVNEMNSLWGRGGRGGRASRSTAVRKSLKEESDEGDDDDKTKHEDDNEEEDNDSEAESKIKSRKSKRMADLAFLGSESESD
ncbi:hypothetical protein GGR57DRAFT_235520 [Xylariaceae sp. FL1272]|nr:hypothetical protein GGR57DRAFT_235520 [Xylariaceae sp. FL1272]